MPNLNILSPKKTIRIPVPLLLLDLIGTILFAVGIIDLVNDSDLVPSSLQFNKYEIVMIITGILFILPFIKYIINYSSGKLPRDI